MHVSVILPTYDEAGNILDLIAAIKRHLASAGHRSDIVVVDDDSPDGTALLVEEHYGNDPDVRLIVRRHERGLATAIRAGVEQSRGRVVVVMDTDFNHDPAVLPRMIRELELADVVVGSRFVKGGGMEDGLRQYLSLGFNLWLRAMVGSRATDNLCGFFAIWHDRLVALPFDAIFFGYGDYFIRLLYAAQRRGYRLREVPVFYRLRRYGVSKTRFVRVFVQYTRVLLGLRLRGLPVPAAPDGASKRQWPAAPSGPVP